MPQPPLSADLAAIPEPDSGYGPHRGRMAGLRLLLVDDQEEHLDSLAAVFEAYGAEVVITDSPRIALDFLKGGGFDLIVGDIVMPIMDGNEFLQSARALPGGRGHVPAIAITGLEGDHVCRKAAEAGYVAVLHKPVSIDTLMEIVERLVGRFGDD